MAKRSDRTRPSEGKEEKLNPWTRAPGLSSFVGRVRQVRLTCSGGWFPGGELGLPACGRGSGWLRQEGAGSGFLLSSLLSDSPGICSLWVRAIKSGGGITLCLGCFLSKLVVILRVFDPFHRDRGLDSAACFLWAAGWSKQTLSKGIRNQPFTWVRCCSPCAVEKPFLNEFSSQALHRYLLIKRMVV